MVTNLLFDYAAIKTLMNGIIRRWNRRLMLDSVVDCCLPTLSRKGCISDYEVGMGIVPESRLARHFRDIPGG